MSDVDALSERIDALEMRLTYQDVTIETLNQTITAQWIEIDRLTRQVAELKERLAGGRKQRAGPGERTTAALLNSQQENGLRKEAAFMHSNIGWQALHHPCIVNQTVAATATATIAAHTTGETFLVLPLRGELLAAWLNSVFIAWSRRAMSAKDAADLVPQRLIFAIAIRLRRRRLRRAHGIGRRKGIDQALLELLVDFAVGRASPRGDRRRACRAAQD